MSLEDNLTIQGFEFGRTLHESGPPILDLIFVTSQSRPKVRISYITVNCSYDSNIYTNIIINGYNNIYLHNLLITCLQFLFTIKQLLKSLKVIPPIANFP